MSLGDAGPLLLNGRCTSLLRVVVSEMTYTVSSGTLNSTILYHTYYTIPDPSIFPLPLQHSARLVNLGRQAAHLSYSSPDTHSTDQSGLCNGPESHSQALALVCLKRPPFRKMEQSPVRAPGPSPMGSAIERIDPLRFLARCPKGLLLSQVSFECGYYVLGQL